MRGWSILTTIENFVSENGTSVGDTEAIYAGCLGQEGDPGSIKTPHRHLRPEDVFVIILDAAKEKWSVGNGLAQFA